jgi:hypothetical protein
VTQDGHHRGNGGEHDTRWRRSTLAGRSLGAEGNVDLSDPVVRIGGECAEAVWRRLQYTQGVGDKAWILRATDFGYFVI